MIKIIRTILDEGNPSIVWARLATLNADREAVVLVISAETDDINQYVRDNETALTARILSEGEIDDRATMKVRSAEGRNLIHQRPLHGKSLAQVERWVDNNYSLLTAKDMIKELAGQIWMLYQMLDDND